MQVRRSKSEKGWSDRLGTEIVNSGSESYSRGLGKLYYIVAKKVGSGLESLIGIMVWSLKNYNCRQIISVLIPWAVKNTVTATPRRGYMYKALITELAYSKHPVNLSS